MKYLDGTLYNLKHKATEIQPSETGEECDAAEKASTARKLSLSSKLLKLRLLSKLHLQMCAMLSQINK